MCSLAGKWGQQIAGKPSLQIKLNKMDLNSKYTIFQSFNYFEEASWPAFFPHVCIRLLCHQLQMSLMCFDMQAGSQGSLCKNLHFWILVLHKTSKRSQFKNAWVQLSQAQGPRRIYHHLPFFVCLPFFFLNPNQWHQACSVLHSVVPRIYKAHFTLQM